LLSLMVIRNHETLLDTDESANFVFHIVESTEDRVELPPINGELKRDGGQQVQLVELVGQDHLLICLLQVKIDEKTFFRRETTS